MSQAERLRQMKQPLISGSRQLVWVGALLLALVLAATTQLPAIRARLLGAAPPKCPAPTSMEDLRQRAIKSYLQALLIDQRELRERGLHYELALVPRTFDAATIESSLRDGSLAHASTAGRLPLDSDAAIDALKVTALFGNATIVQISTQLREVTLIPLESVRSASAAEMEADARSRHQTPFRLEPDEQARGFGAGRFWISRFPAMSLSCCDDRGEKQGRGPAWHIKNDIKTLRSTRARFIVVDQCGGLLTREEQGYVYRQF